MFQTLRSPALVLVIGCPRVRVRVERALRERGLAPVVADLRSAMAMVGATTILLHVERWTAEAAAIVHRLAASGASPFVVCPDAVCEQVYLAMLEGGALDAASDDECALRALVLQGAAAAPTAATSAL